MSDTTELALVEPAADEVVEAEVLEPLSEREAKALDKRIRQTSDKVSTNVNALVDLLERAATGQIHVALGIPSWTAYVKDAVQINVTDRLERKSLVQLMSGKGMSQRAIAGTLGVSQKTVDRDLEDAPEADAAEAEVVGLDGKAYKKVKDPKPKPQVEPEVPGEPVKAPSFGDDFRDEIYQLQNDVKALQELVQDERFEKARKRLAASKPVRDFGDALDALTEVYNRIVEDGTIEAEVVGES